MVAAVGDGEVSAPQSVLECGSCRPLSRVEMSMGVLGASLRSCQPNWEANCSLIGGQRKDPFLFLGILGTGLGKPLNLPGHPGEGLLSHVFSSSVPSPR